MIGMMLHFPKINDYLKILMDEKVKDFVDISFSKYFKSIREEQNLRKVAKSISIFLTTPDEVQRHVLSNSSDHCVHHHYVEISIFLIQIYN